MRTKILMLSCLLMLAASVQAGTWTGEAPIADLDHPMATDGTLVKASNFGPTAAAQTIDGIAFDIDYSNIINSNDPAVGASGLGLYTGSDPAVDNLLNTCGQYGNDGKFTFGLSGLTIGYDYRLQIITSGTGWRIDLYGDTLPPIPPSIEDQLFDYQWAAVSSSRLDLWTYEWTADDTTRNPRATLWESSGEEARVFAYAVHSFGSSLANDSSPTPGATLVPVESQLQWGAPTTYSPVGYRVYFGTTEPNVLFADYGLTELTSGIENITSIAPSPSPMAFETTYYWVVDAYESGPTKHPGLLDWSFTTEPDDAVPDPNIAQSGIHTWVAAQPTVLTALVNDDAEGDVVSSVWTVIDAPPTVLAPDPNTYLTPGGTLLAPTCSLDVGSDPNNFGFYEIQLASTDATAQTGIDTVWVSVAENECMATKEVWDGAYWWTVNKPGDINTDVWLRTGDCKVDLEDIAVLVSDWLDDVSLTTPYIYY